MSLNNDKVHRESVVSTSVYPFMYSSNRRSKLLYSGRKEENRHVSRSWRRSLSLVRHPRVRTTCRSSDGRSRGRKGPTRREKGFLAETTVATVRPSWGHGVEFNLLFLSLTPSSCVSRRFPVHKKLDENV